MNPEERYERIKGLQPLELLYKREAEEADKVFLRQMYQRQWRDYTWGEVMARARRVAGFLRSQFEPGDRIALHAKNCADWVIVDVGIMLAEMISVPLYPGQSASSMSYVLQHSESKLLFCGATDNRDALLEVVDSIPTVAIHRCEIHCDQELDTVISTNAPYDESPVFDEDNIFTIMYTSGTTGHPKGVMHAWSSVVFVAPNMVRGYGYSESDRFFSYLPLAHAAERILIEFHSLYSGTPVYFPESLETFLEDLRRTRPTMFFSVPRLWSRFKQQVDQKIPPAVQNIILYIPGLSTWLGNRVRSSLGLDQARLLVTGASPISIELLRWYHRMGMKVADGYGMTENFIYGCIAHRDEDPVPGTVGKPQLNCELKISAQGEILFKSDSLMKGYYREPEKTADVIREGYYHTGDSGYIDEDGLVHITGRISESFKTSKGKFIQPSLLEGAFSNEPLLAQCCVLGHGMDQPVLLATVSELAETLSREEIRARLMKLLGAVNQRLSHHERIKLILIGKEEWTAVNGLLTPTMKTKRKELEARYQPLLKAFANSEGIIWEPPDSASQQEGNATVEAVVIDPVIK
ncbi:AMP-binding protein [Microbulbifer spongiae]|uniref:AMP-binding protein n=1 Tax=Microbulbifer spongiae TaxID=2944933 RepID=A0ABY9E9A5_9GAMM|nr:AMP-binding protein [Microbulbifer sp. MI-G]WKD48712.1 AMP-binding protein [Microbulbifer sp. MI-G]